MTPTPVSSTTIAMLLADARLPAGAHVSSNGLEPALLDGLAPNEVPLYLRARMGSIVIVEAATAVVASRGIQENGGEDWLRRVEAEWAARTPSPALREVTRALGAGLARLASRVWPQDALLADLARRPLARPVVLGAVARVAGLADDDLARLVAYDDAQTVAAALLKLEPLDPAIPVSWVLDACATFEDHVTMIAALTTPEAIPAFGAPQIEEWAQRHSRLTRRLFRA